MIAHQIDKKRQMPTSGQLMVLFIEQMCRALFRQYCFILSIKGCGAFARIFHVPQSRQRIGAIQAPAALL